MASLKLSILLLLCVVFVLVLQVECGPPARRSGTQRKPTGSKNTAIKETKPKKDDDDDDKGLDGFVSAGNGLSRRSQKKPGKLPKGDKQKGIGRGGKGKGKGKPVKGNKAKKVLALGSSIDKFSISLYKKMAVANPNNFVFSPFSVFSGLSLVLLGASGRTNTELTSGLSLQSPSHPAIKMYNESLPLARDDDTVLALANNFYYKPGLKLKQGFVQKLRKFYGATAEPFQAVKPEDAINDWVEDKTNGKISDFLPPGSITPSVHAMLINAVYFKGAWNTKFDESDTESLPFYVTPSQSVNTDAMRQFGGFRMSTSRTLGATILELPYAGNRFALFVFLPQANLSDVESKLSADLLSADISDIIQTSAFGLQVQLPKFKLDTKESMKELLTSIGISQMFDPSKATFTKLTKDKNVAFSEVLHQAVIEVDEEGTVAAAVTAFPVFLSSRPPEVIVNRPFMFVLRDKVYGINLFIGRYINPGGENLKH